MKILIIVLSVGVLALTIGAAPYYPQNQNASPYYSMDSDSTNYSASQDDRELLNRVKQAINDRSGKFNNVQVRIEKKVVTITGSVANDQDRRDLKNKIQNVQGVQKVDDQLKTDSTSSYNNRPSQSRFISLADDESKPYNAKDDGDVANKIREELKPGMFSKGYTQVQVAVRNGVVTLAGTVDTENDRQAVVDRVKKVKGIQSINDQLTVARSK